MIFAAVLSSALFLGRQFTRLMHQQTLEAQGRRTLLYLTQDAQMASSVTSLSATSATFNLVTTTGTTTVVYNYDNTTRRLTRTPAGGTALTLLSNVTNNGCTFSYYDTSGRPYTTYVNYLSGVKQISLAFSTQTGTASLGTQTPIYRGSSARLIIRNKVLPF